MSLNNIPTYTFYNKEWYIAANIIKEFKLSSSYNTYYSNSLSNGRLLGPAKSFEFRLSGTYLKEFIDLYGANNPSLSKSSAIWLVDEESAKKIIHKQNTNIKNTITIESNRFSIEYNLGVAKQESVAESLRENEEIKELTEQIIKNRKDKYSYKNKSEYAEEEISDAITLLSSKLTTNPYQQEKLLNSGSIRIDLFCATRRNITAIELKNHTITLEEVKKKIEEKQYINNLIAEFPDLPITFIFSGPAGIDLDAFIYLQQTSKSIGPHKLIYKPISNLLLDMINKKEKDLPSYYYEQLFQKPIMQSLLQLQ